MQTAPEVKIHSSLRKGLALFDADRLRWLDEAAPQRIFFTVPTSLS